MKGEHKRPKLANRDGHAATYGSRASDVEGPDFDGMQ